MKKMCDNVDLTDDMIVIYDDQSMTLKEAIEKCKPGYPIEGIHPLQYDKLQKIFEEKRNKKLQYSVDMRYGDWRFILFDNPPVKENKITYINPLCDVIKLNENVKPISFPNSDNLIEAN